MAHEKLRNFLLESMGVFATQCCSKHVCVYMRVYIHIYTHIYIYIYIYVYCHISQSTSEVFAASGGVASASSGQDPGSWKAVAIELEYVCAHLKP